MGRRRGVPLAFMTAMVTAVGGAMVLPAAMVPATASSLPLCQGKVATIIGTARADIVWGTRGRDVILARAGNDVVHGRGGNDLICGGPGRDTVIGGDGADQIYGGPNDDRLAGGNQDDRLRGGHGEDDLSGGLGDDHLNGGTGQRTWFRADAGNDVWTAESTDAVLDYGRAPRGVSVDLLTGSATGWGHDTLRTTHWDGFPPIGRPILLGSQHDDTLVSALEGIPPTWVGNLPVWGTVIKGSGGNDVIRGTASMKLLGNEGDDRVTVQISTVEGFTNRSLVDGGDGTDGLSMVDVGGVNIFVTYQHLSFDLSAGQIHGGGQTDVPAPLFENAMIDTVRFDPDPQEASYELDGTDGPNTLTVDSAHPSVINGGGGDDVLTGGSADDTIDGGAGDDTADGREGTDTCTSVEQPSNCETAIP